VCSSRQYTKKSFGAISFRPPSAMMWWWLLSLVASEIPNQSFSILPSKQILALRFSAKRYKNFLSPFFFHHRIQSFCLCFFFEFYRQIHPITFYIHKLFFSHGDALPSTTESKKKKAAEWCVPNSTIRAANVCPFSWCRPARASALSVYSLLKHARELFGIFAPSFFTSQCFIQSQQLLWGIYYIAT
jgi:hypothetical protein